MFHNRIRELRKSKNLSQEELADLLGVSSSAIGYYENNKRHPDINTINRFTDFFQVSADYLLGNTDSQMRFDEVAGEEIKNYFEHPDMVRLFRLIKEIPKDRRKEAISFLQDLTK